MNKKIGRNDPCPCGSGKKYKFCCGANTYGGTIIAFPGNQIENGQEDFMGFMDKPNVPTEVSEKLREAIGDRVFRSKEEAEQFFTRFQNTYNTAPCEDFLGLSPDQMRRIFEAEDLNTLKDIVSLSPKPFAKEALTVPLVKMLHFLLNEYRANNNSLPLTPKGNYKRVLTRQAAKIIFKKGYEERYINRERDVWILWFIHDYLLAKDLVLDGATCSTLSPAGEDLANNFNADEAWKDLFDYCLFWINWQESASRYHQSVLVFDLIQRTAIASLYFLSRRKGSWVSEDEMSQEFWSIFPIFDKIPLPTGLDIPKFNYINLFLCFFCKDLGLIEFEASNPLNNGEDFRNCRSTELFKKALVWMV